MRLNRICEVATCILHACLLQAGRKEKFEFRSEWYDDYRQFFYFSLRPPSLSPPLLLSPLLFLTWLKQVHSRDGHNGGGGGGADAGGAGGTCFATQFEKQILRWREEDKETARRWKRWDDFSTFVQVAGGFVGVYLENDLYFKLFFFLSLEAG